MTNFADPFDHARHAEQKDTTAGLLAFVIVMLLLVHLSGDIIYGFETGVTIHAVAAIIAGAWLALVLVLGPRRKDCWSALESKFAQCVFD
jgi:hypothetical protein